MMRKPPMHHAGMRIKHRATVTASTPPADTAYHITHLPLDRIRPNPLQARRVLPGRIYQHFHNERLSASQALAELIKLAKIEARHHGRPFDQVMDLLSHLEDEHTTEPLTWTPLELLLRDLTHLALTIHANDQINPITVITDPRCHHFRIETGERRYWATWLLNDFIPGSSGEYTIPCRIIPQVKASPFRMAEENTTRIGLNAVAMARQIALLLLHVHDYEMPQGPVSMDFYRQALTLDLRGKREYSETVYAALGGISRQMFQYHKALLRLCDEAIEIADRHNIAEKKLRYVVSLEPDDQVEILRQTIQLNLTAKQIHDLIEKGQPGLTFLENNSETLPRSAMQIAKLTLKPDGRLDPDTLARALIRIEQDKQIAKARLTALRDMLEAVVERIDTV